MKSIMRSATFSGLLFLLSDPSYGQRTEVNPPSGETAAVSLVDLIESSNYDADFSAGEATTNTPAELDAIYAPTEGYLESYGVRRPLDFIADPLLTLYEKTGLRIGFASTVLFAQPIGGQSSNSGTGGDLDLMTSWTLIGRGTEDTGRLVASAEYRYEMGNQTPSELRGKMGTLIAPVGTFNDRGDVIRDLYWVQRLFDARLRIILGRAAPDDYVGSHWLQNVNHSFVNRNFSANPGIPFPGHGPMLGASIRPTDQYYLTGGVSNAYSDTEKTEIQSLFDEWDLFYFAEVGYTPTLEGFGAGRYALGVWRMDARDVTGQPSDSGFTLIADQNLNADFQVFGRYSYSDATLTNVRQLGQVGAGFNGILGRDNDLTGLAVSLGVPRDGVSRNETAIEAFHRFQINRFNQISIGFQLIANPATAPESETAGLFYMRLRTAF